MNSFNSLIYQYDKEKEELNRLVISLREELKKLKDFQKDRNSNFLSLFGDTLDEKIRSIFFELVKKELFQRIRIEGYAIWNRVNLEIYMDSELIGKF